MQVYHTATVRTTPQASCQLREERLVPLRDVAALVERAVSAVGDIFVLLVLGVVTPDFCLVVCRVYVWVAKVIRRAVD